ncbi:AzlD domain-containing protein [Brevibacterium sp. FAM 27836]|uniref:AzlD domain-containing protein n=1 Tax=Brevibacterium sp. FAM 27836 TaxID=3446693 RepID=UPI003F519358
MHLPPVVETPPPLPEARALPLSRTPPPADSTERVTKWMDRATVVLIGAVFATTAIFDGKDIADPARLIGVGVGVFAAIVRVPMLLAVAIGMAVCAVIRMTGVL